MGRSRARLGGRPPMQTRTPWRQRQVPAPHANPHAAVHLATDMGELASEMVQTAADDIADAFDEHLSALMRQARRDWPQPGNAPAASGYSVGQLGVRVQVKGDTILSTVSNAAVYAGYIKQAAHSNTRPRDRVLFDPGMKTAEELAKAIADHLGD